MPRRHGHRGSRRRTGSRDDDTGGKIRTRQQCIGDSTAGAAGMARGPVWPGRDGAPPRVPGRPPRPAGVILGASPAPESERERAGGPPGPGRPVGLGGRLDCAREGLQVAASCTIAKKLVCVGPGCHGVTAVGAASGERAGDWLRAGDRGEQARDAVPRPAPSCRVRVRTPSDSTASRGAGPASGSRRLPCRRRRPWLGRADHVLHSIRKGLY